MPHFACIGGRLAEGWMQRLFKLKHWSEMKLSFGWQEWASYLTSGLISGRVAGIRHSQRNLHTWLKLLMILRDSGQLQGALHSSRANFKLISLEFISQLYWTIWSPPISQVFFFHTCYFFYLNLSNQALFYFSASNFFTKKLNLLVDKLKIQGVYI